MDRVAGTEGFDIANERFVLIGITGQTYSGQSSMFNEVLANHHLGVMDHSGVYEDLVLAYLDGHEDAVNWYKESGTTPPRREADGNVIFNEGSEDSNFIHTPGFLQDKEKMHFLRSHSFKTKMPRIAEGLRSIAEANPYITKDMQVPIFVDLPMCGEVNYFDYVDKIIVTTRPRINEPSSWYVKYITGNHDPNNDNFIDLWVNLDLVGYILDTDDYAFDQIIELISNDVQFVDNNGTYEEYLAKCKAVLEQYTQVSQDAIRPIIEQKIKEVF